jgi:phosphatidylserine decarboxylase
MRLNKKINRRIKLSILKEGFPFIFIPLGIAAALFIIPAVAFSGAAIPVVLACVLPGALALLFACFCAFFFRDPKVKVNGSPGAILSPCNGTVLEVLETENEKVLRIFLSIFNVHLQRSPFDGTVKSVEHKDGLFLAAWNPDAHSQNEQNIITIETGKGVFLVRQIAGFLARRCVSWVKAGDTLKAGDKIGLIKFSSQVDLHLPGNAEITVKLEDKVRAGITAVGVIK